MSVVLYLGILSLILAAVFIFMSIRVYSKNNCTSNKKSGMYSFIGCIAMVIGAALALIYMAPVLYMLILIFASLF